MTAVRLPVPARAAWTAGAAIAVGCAALTLRPTLVSDAAQPTAVLVGLFIGLGAVGLALPIPAAVPAPRAASTWTTTMVGLSVFLVGRMLLGGAPVGAVTTTALLLHSLAAVAEEIWFRRVVFGWLTPAGPGVAIVGSAALFAVVHVTTYGAWVLPLDVAAGLVFAWQRDATGSWHVPAFTHVVANVLALL